MRDEKIERKFKELGFTAYEAKAYLSLLRQNPVTRYELSKNSGVPRSAIYDIIRKLEKLGAANALYVKPEKYIPLPPEQLLELLERQFNERIDEAKQSLKKFTTEVEPGHLWNIVGYKNMLHKAREMIAKAQHSIYLSLWQRECRLLKEDLDQAISRGVQITAFSFTPLDIKSERVYSYNIPDKELNNIWDRKIILVIDKNELIMGEADDKHNKKTAWTDNKAIVDIATNHMILDITLFGMRKKMDVADTVMAMESSGFENLGKLLNGNPDHELEALVGKN